MRIFSRLLLSSAILGLSQLTPAKAADLDLPIFVEEAPELVPVEIGSGWYLRGDVSYAITNSPGTFNYRTFDTVTGTYAGGAFATSDLDTDLGVGVGFGYTFNRWLRADVTVDRFGGSFSGTTAGNPPCISPTTVAGYAGTTCGSVDSADFTAWTGMANGYVDLGTFVGITPYVGAGAGVTWVNWDAMSSSNFCANGTGACPTNFVSTTSYPGESDVRFAYAFMAGVAMDVSKNLKIDLGYRYRHIAGGTMARWNATSTAAGATGTRAEDNGFSTHEIKVGLRYELW